MNKDNKIYYNKTADECILDSEQLASNGNPQVPVLFCVDCSYSMCQNGRLDAVLAGLEDFRREIAGDCIARDSLQLSLVSFHDGVAREEMPFCTAKDMKLPKLEASGDTPLAPAVQLSLDLIRKRQEELALYGNVCYRPWLVIISDGDDTGAPEKLEEAARALQAEYEARHLNVHCITVGDEDRTEYTSLMKLSPQRLVYYLRDLKFQEFFSWLSRSIEKTSQSLQSEEILFPTGDWGEVRMG